MSQSVSLLSRRILRLQRRNLGSTAIILTTLAIALGGATTVFSVVDPLLLRPLPFPAPDELSVVSSAFPQMHAGGLGLSGPEALEFIRMTDAFAHVGVIAFDSATVGAKPDPVNASTALASAATFETLRPPLAAGRLYDAPDDVPGAAPTAVLGFEFWRRAFGADPSVVGRTVPIDGVSTTVVGVLSLGTLLNRPIDVWLPLRLTAATAGNRADHRYTVIARRKPGVADGAARANVDAVVQRWQMATGEFHSPTLKFHPLEVQTLTAATTGRTATPLLALAASVALVVIIACANVGGLLLARAQTRRVETAAETALGASRRDILLLYICEAHALAAVGGCAGAALAAFGIAAVSAFGPAIVRPEDIQLNARVLLFASAAAIAVGGAVGAVPALALGGNRTVRSLQSGGRGMVGGGARGIQRILVGLELALAIVLAVSAVVVVRNLIDLTRVDPGFRAERVVRAQIALPSDAYESDERTFAFYDSAIQRLRGVPGFRSVAAMSGAPPLRPANNTTFALDSATVPLDHRSVPQVDFIQHVTPGYFDVMGIALRRGRAFTDADSERSAPVAIVNETLARRFWPGQSAVDRKLRPYGLGTPWFTVVGVAADVKQAGLQASPGGEFYVPYRQARRLFGTWVPRTMNIVASTAGNPAEAGPEIRSVVRALDPSAAVSNVEAMTEVISNSISQPRLIATILTAFACVALLLASVGVYGVTSAFAKARTAELGVRAALGATPARLVRHVLCASATAIIGGVCLGTAAAFAVSRFLSVLVYSPASRPSVVLNVTVGLSFSAVSLLSMIVPAVRASRVDPLTALRQL